MKAGSRAATTLTSKGQVVIPKAIRERLRWRPGMRLELEALPGGAVRLRPDETDPINQAWGFLSEGDPVSDLESEHRTEVERDERWRRGRR